MSLISLIVVLVVVGVILWAVNTFGAQYMDSKILRILNIIVVIAVVLWLLSVFLPGLGGVGDISVGK